MAKILSLLVGVALFLQVPASSERQQEESPDQCQRQVFSDASLQNCTVVKRYFYYDAENQICHPYDDCEENGANRFTRLKTCLDTCFSGPKKAARRCQQQLKGKAPERCRWVRAAAANVAGCPRYQLQCTGGPCSTRPCRAPCEICTYNLEFTVRNCSLVTRMDGDGEECPPPFRCERDIRCKSDTTDLVEGAELTTVGVTASPASPPSSKRPSTSPKPMAQPATSSTTNEPTVQTEEVAVSASPRRSLLASTTTAEAVSQKTACFLPVKYEPCAAPDTAERLVWYFDLQSKLCRKFYGAHTCAGNANGFPTKEECVRVCQSQAPCPEVVREALPIGCHYEERKASDGCLTLAMLCTGKPGRCPLATGKGAQTICYKECDRDADCKDEKKCCANGCASLCLAPAPPLLPAPTSKPGSSSSAGASTAAASSSAERSPSSERIKAGACPREKRHSPGHRNCSEKCTVDIDCHGAKKCCSLTGCGRVCHSPMEASPSKPRNPCFSSPCLPHERCVPLPPSSSASKRSETVDASHICEPIEDFAAFDPCKNGKHTCGEEERCVYEPQLCLVGPCSQYRCIPSPPPGFRRKSGDGANVKRRAEAAPLDVSNDPCSLNPCKPCQRCVPVGFTGEHGQQLMVDPKFLGYRCESDCPGQCEECTLSGRCVVVRQPYVCRTNRAGDPCQNRTCDSYPTAKCLVDPCHCLRARFAIESGVEISADECRRSLHM